MNTSKLTGAELVLECSDRERRAIRMVRLAMRLSAAALYDLNGPDIYWMDEDRLHANFPHFPLSLGVVGGEYEMNTSRSCSAVDLYIRSFSTERERQQRTVDLTLVRWSGTTRALTMNSALEEASRLCINDKFRNSECLLNAANLMLDNIFGPLTAT